MIGDSRIWRRSRSRLSLLPWTGRGEGRAADVCAYCARVAPHVHPLLIQEKQWEAPKSPSLKNQLRCFHHQSGRALAQMVFSDLCLISSELALLIVWWLFCGIFVFVFFNCFEEGVWCGPPYMLQLGEASSPRWTPLCLVCPCGLPEGMLLSG